MKVVVSTADSASVKEVSFSKFVDTTKKESDAPSTQLLLPSAGNGPKKSLAVTHLSVRDEDIAIARKNGCVQLNDTELVSSGTTCVGLEWGAPDTEHAGTIFFFGSDGTGWAHNTVSNKRHTFSVRPNLTTVISDPSTPLRFASAGLEPLPNVFELVFGKNQVDVVTKWEAVPPPNNILDLPERNLVNCLGFTDKDTLVAATEEGFLRVYDLLNEDPDVLPGQPVDSVKASQSAFKSMAVDPTRKDAVIVGDSRTTVGRWSLRPNKLLGHYKGVNGSTRCISCRGKFVAMGGLDRYLRVFDIEKRQPAGRVYLGEEIWDLALVKQDEEEDIDDVDTLWNDLGLANKRKKTDTKEKQAATKKDNNESEEESEEEDSEEDDSAEDDSEDESDEEDSEDEEGSDEEDYSDSGESFQGFD